MTEAPLIVRSQWLASSKGIAYVLGVAGFGAISGVSWSRQDIRQALISSAISVFLALISWSQARKRDLALAVDAQGVRLAGFPLFRVRSIPWNQVVALDLDEESGFIHLLLRDESRVLVVHRENAKQELVKIAEDIDLRRPRKKSSA